MNSEGEFWFRFCCWYFIKNVSLLWRGEKLWAFGVTSNDYCNNRRFAGKRCLSDVNWVFMDQHFCIPSHIYKWGTKYYISICKQRKSYSSIEAEDLKTLENPKIHKIKNAKYHVNVFRSYNCGSIMLWSLNSERVVVCFGRRIQIQRDLK